MHPSRKVAIVADSSTSLPNTLIQQYDITIVPQKIIFQDQIYRDGVDIDSAQFYSTLRRSKTIPTTSAPNPFDFLDPFYSAKKRAESILCITLSQRLSATYSAATTACELLQEEYPDFSIKLFDSGTSIGAEGLIVLAAARLAMLNKSMDQVESAAKFVQNRVRQFAFLDTLHYLAKGGRIPKLSAWIGSLLQFKPLLELSHGNARLLAKPRSRAKAIDHLIRLVSEDAKGAPLRVNLLHAQAYKEILAIHQRVERELNCIELLISEFAPVVGAHTGPGVLGLAYYSTKGE